MRRILCILFLLVAMFVPAVSLASEEDDDMRIKVAIQLELYRLSQQAPLIPAIEPVVEQPTEFPEYPLVYSAVGPNLTRTLGASERLAVVVTGTQAAQFTVPARAVQDAVADMSLDAHRERARAVASYRGSYGGGRMLFKGRLRMGRGGGCGG